MGLRGLRGRQAGPGGLSLHARLEEDRAGRIPQGLCRHAAMRRLQGLAEPSEERAQGHGPGRLLGPCQAQAGRSADGKAFSAAVPLKLVQKLYAVEAEAREHDAATRLVLRQRDAVPIMADLKAWLAKHYGATRPSSPLGKAVEYLHNQWDMLQVYLSDGRVSIDNNWVENHLRPICVGKKNYLFAGSDEGAERAAVIYTVLANCKLAGVEPWAYLNDVVAELAQLRVGMKPEDVVAIERSSHLGPQEWLAARRAVAPAS